MVISIQQNNVLSIYLKFIQTLVKAMTPLCIRVELKIKSLPRPLVFNVRNTFITFTRHSSLIPIDTQLEECSMAYLLTIVLANFFSQFFKCHTFLFFSVTRKCVHTSAAPFVCPHICLSHNVLHDLSNIWMSCKNRAVCLLRFSPSIQTLQFNF